MDENETVVFPQDLAALSAEELTALEGRALTEFDTLVADEDVDDTGIARMTELADGVQAVRAETQRRATAVTTRAASRTAAVDRVQKMRATSIVTASTETDTEGTEPTGEAEPGSSNDGGTGEGGAQVTTTKTVAATTTPPRKRASLAVAQERAPRIPETVTATTDKLRITATAPTSSVQLGTQFSDFDALVAAVQHHAKSQVVTSGLPQFQTVASMENRFDEVIDGGRASLRDFEHMAQRLRANDAVEAMIAGGGWCAPSPFRYDFFNIACQDGTIDLPTFGVDRGGIQFPVSPSMADVFTGTFTNATNPWLWTEADDILTVTGGPNKPCVRVPCASFTDRRLECYGICLTAGNLTDYAWPEATRNYLSLLMSAHYHAMNQRIISQMVELSTSAIAFPTGAGMSILADLPDRMAIAANDIRTRFGMCEDDVLEAVVPRWVPDAMRSDAARRSGDAAYLNLSDAEINSMFNVRRLRIQWVNDWQIRGTGQFGGATALTGWPSSVMFMMYPAGTFMLGNGLSLDLGVTRDSVLNADNDHTAAWTEECHLVARVGHESRLYSLPVCVGGKTGTTFDNCYVAS